MNFFILRFELVWVKEEAEIKWRKKYNNLMNGRVKYLYAGLLLLLLLIHIVVVFQLNIILLYAHLICD